MRFIYLQHIPYRHLSEGFTARFPAVDLRVLDLMRTGHSKNSKPSRSVVLHAGIWHWPDSILALAFPLSALPDQSNGRTRP